MEKPSEITVYNPKTKQDEVISTHEAGMTDQYFTLGGKQVTSDSPVAYAKKSILADGTTHYYVKRSKSDGHIFDPNGMLSQGKEFVTKGGIAQVQFRKVNEKVYNLYMKYLETRNPAWLRNAEREMINA